MPEELIKTVYPNITTNANAWLVEQAILAPLNNMANSINGDMVHEFKRKIMKCTSIESVISEDQAVHFLIDFFNSIQKWCT